MNNVVNTFNRVLATLLAGLMLALVAAVVWQVFSRYVLAEPSSVTEELARFLLIWLGVLGSVYAYGQRMHLGLDIFVKKRSESAQIKLQGVADVVVLVVAISVFILGGGNLVEMTWRLTQTSAALGIPMAYVYAILPISGLLLAFYSVLFVSEATSRAVNSSKEEV